MPHVSVSMPYSSLDTEQVSVSESGACTRCRQSSSGFPVKAWIEVRGMDIAPSAVATLRVYVASIAAEHVQVGDVSLGSHILISHFCAWSETAEAFLSA